MLNYKADVHSVCYHMADTNSTTVSWTVMGVIGFKPGDEAQPLDYTLQG